jgi:luciferase family oxidoreductase group 1
MPSDFTLGALDLCKLYHGQSHQEVIWESIELAPRVEAMGYSRYWLAEHHAFDVAHGSPEMLVPVLAGVTRKMRVGIAGVLLRLYSPYKVAENFRLLHTIYPGRIDLGIARGSVEPSRERALLTGGPGTDFEEKLSQLLRYVRGTGRPVANPARTPAPEIWMLGTKTTSAKLAAENGTAFSMAMHLDPAGEPPVREILEEYRDNFKPCAELKEPRWIVALAGICGRSVDEARSLLSRQEMGVRANVVGTPHMWREKLERIRDETATTEFVVMDLCGGLEARTGSYELLARAMQ